MRYEIPGAVLEIEHLLLDLNGTLTDRGRLIDGVETQLRRLGERLEIRLLSADTFGTLDGLASELGIEAERVLTGEVKQALVRQLGAQRCAAIGNGRNDVPMLEAVALGIAVIGPEGSSAAALMAADVVCGSIGSALELLLDPVALSATLRP